MARNKKATKNKLGEGRSKTIVLKVDPETKALWNLAVKHMNMSDWFRKQLIFHFSNHLTSQQRILFNKEAIQLLQIDTEDRISHYEALCRKIANDNGARMQKLKDEIDRLREQEKEVIQ